MRIPKYRAGELVEIPYSYLYGGRRNKSKSVTCRILYPIGWYKYFVQILPDNGYAYIPHNIITTPPETAVNPLPDPKGISVVFFGNGETAVPSLMELHRNGFNIVAVVTSPDAPKGRHKNKSVPTPVKIAATSLSLPLLQPENIRGLRFRRKLRELGADIGAVVDFKILPFDVYALPQYGTVNMHTSLLPQYRGASPVTAALNDGLSTTGVTTFLVDEGVDTGDIINNMAVAVNDDEVATEVTARLRQVGAVMLSDALRRVVAGCTPFPQHCFINDFIKVSTAPKIKRSDARINWNKSAAEIMNHIRAYGFTPGAWARMLFNDTFSADFKIIRAHIKERDRLTARAPGCMFRLDGEVAVSCRDANIIIETIQISSRKAMSATDFLNGYADKLPALCY